MPQMKSALPILMLSIEKCNEILNKKELKYTTDQVKEIRETLYQYAEIFYESNLLKDEELRRQECNSLSKS